MFESEIQMEPGVNFRSYRFRGGKNNEPLLSIMVRITDKAEEGHAVFNPIVEARKAEMKEKMKLFEQKEKTWIPRWFWGKKFKADMQALAQLRQSWANPLFDFPEEEGLAVINKIELALIEKGLSLKSHTKKSNGDMMEDHYLFA